jgi:hypothetical protein
MNNLCSPAMLYLLIATISIIGAFIKGMSIMSIVVKVFFVALWTWFLNFLCSKGHIGISWFLVLLPFAMLMLAVVFSVELMRKMN